VLSANQLVYLGADWKELAVIVYTPAFVAVNKPLSVIVAPSGVTAHLVIPDVFVVEPELVHMIC
jgi:hypothetical protein